MREPLKVRTSPNAMRIVGWISPSGGQQNPATSIVHPKMHNAVARMSWSFFIILNFRSFYC